MDSSSTTSPTMAEAIQCNNLGVSMVHNSNYKSAIHYFQRSLTVTRRALHQMTQSSSIPTTTASPEVTEATVNTWIAHSINATTVKHHVSNNGSSSPYICRNPIVMQLDNSDSQLPPAAYAAITLFNLGLTYNLEGLNNKVNNRIDAMMGNDALLHVPFYLQTQHDE